MAKKHQCPQPPGGSITCSDDQVAICGTEKDGTPIRQCASKPIGYNNMALVNWALETITGQSRRPNEFVSRQDVETLFSGRFVSSNRKVSFSLPDFIMTAIKEIDEK